MTNQLAMVLLFAGGFLFGGVATLLLRWWRGRKPVVHQYHDAGRIAIGEVMAPDGIRFYDEPPKPIPYKPRGGPVPGAPVTREEWDRLKAQINANVSIANMNTDACRNLEARIAALEAVQAHELPDGVRVWALDNLGNYFRVWDGRAMWAKHKDDGSDWFSDAPHTPRVMGHLRELHGPEALAVYEDWKARKE